MKIRLIRDLPLDPRHGCKKGREFNVTSRGIGRNAKYSFIGEDGEECAAYEQEIEVVKDDDARKAAGL